jgi:hypothetical protein
VSNAAAMLMNDFGTQRNGSPPGAAETSLKSQAAFA